ncbi:MAG: hypothetical protein AB7O65_01090 [Candidatus Korobacteraceae bacterium]
MAACIYPGPHSSKMSEEHSLPAGLGEYVGSRPLLDRICVDCNNKLGNELEIPFLRVGPVGLLRWIIGIRGRKGTSPSPFRRNAGKTRGVIAMGKISSLPFPIALEIDPGTQDAHPMRQIVMKHPLLGIQPFPIFDNTTPDAFRTEINEAGFSSGTPIRGFALLTERHWLETLARAVGGVPDVSWNQFHSTSETIEVETTVTIKPRLFLREIAKIAFHYMLQVCPSFSGNERSSMTLKTTSGPAQVRLLSLSLHLKSRVTSTGAKGRLIGAISYM